MRLTQGQYIEFLGIPAFCRHENAADLLAETRSGFARGHEERITWLMLRAGHVGHRVHGWTRCLALTRPTIRGVPFANLHHGVVIDVSTGSGKRVVACMHSGITSADDSLVRARSAIQAGDD